MLEIVFSVACGDSGTGGKDFCNGATLFDSPDSISSLGVSYLNGYTGAPDSPV